MNPNCGECGCEDGDTYKECCGVYMCDDCSDRHDVKWGHADEPLEITITDKGREMLKGRE